MSDLPEPRRYAIEVREPSGHSRRMGRMRVEVTASEARVLTRRGEVVESWPLVSMTREGKGWELVAQDGSVVSLKGCGCGG